jgi:hypothetical protein
MSRLSSLRCLAFGTGLILFPALLSGQTNALLKTKDGLALAIAPNGFVASLRLDQREVPLSRVPAMFWIRDAAAKSRLLPIKCSVQTGPDALRVISVDKPLGVEITARIVSRGDFLQVDGEVVEHSGRARCLDLKISLPITTNGFAFGTGLSGTSGTKASGQKPKKNLPADSEVDESIPDENAWYPIAPITQPGPEGRSISGRSSYASDTLPHGRGRFRAFYPAASGTFSGSSNTWAHSVSDYSLSPRPGLGLSFCARPLL